MNKDQAIKILEQALNSATQKGVYNLADVFAIIKSLEKIKELVELSPSED